MKFPNKIVILTVLSLCFCCEDILSCANFNFSNKVVIVTGGSSGIGASTAIQFAKAGACVTIVGRNEIRLKQVADKISLVGKPALVVKAELSRDEEAKQVIQKTVDKFGKIDVLVNCAGFSIPTNFSDENFIERFDAVLNVNLRAIVVLTNCAVPYLKTTKGNILNIASVAAQKGSISSKGLHYSASKAGVVMFTKSCAMELAEFGIRANTVSPGFVKTNFHKAAGVDNFDYQKVVEKKTALKIVIQPEEIADVVLYLTSDKARSITGSDFVIDAGVLVYDPYASLAN